ncbi:hypothetical protein GCK32_011430 [Trichostrongylus colubriformis]|uniref:Uncharacterized protein n=1 Tax=Trichostrongylus colubriformis TaxID=6319 RepID=A0AAN8EW15_TRICO
MLPLQFICAILMITGILAEVEHRAVARCPSLSYILCADGMMCIHKSDGSDEREFCHGWMALTRNGTVKP